MRENKFRGKRIDNGEWVYGSYFCGEKISLIVVCARETQSIDIYTVVAYQVDPETVGQYTGLKDKNGVDVYENDIFKDDENEGTEIIVVFENGSFCLQFSGITGSLMPYGFDEDAGGFNVFECLPIQEYEVKEMEVIGNIHDNPELLEVK